jgi:acylphosphatase
VGVRGWARNLSDGRVEAVFEGEREAVEQLLTWCHQGPPHAHVTGVEILDEEPVGDTSFEVR